jgi:hypothetical protein
VRNIKVLLDEILHALSQINPCRDPCVTRDVHGYGATARGSSVDQDVLLFVFPIQRSQTAR